MNKTILQSFEVAMWDLPATIKRETGYRASELIRMLAEREPLAVARQLITRTTTGFTAMWMRGRLDLAVEALVVAEPFRSLFTEEEVAIAQERLASTGYNVANLPQAA